MKANRIEITYKNRRGEICKSILTNGGKGFKQEELDNVVYAMMNDSRVVNIEIKEN